MSPVSLRSLRHVLVTSLFLLASAAAAAASAPPIGIHQISVFDSRLRPTPNRYRSLSGDGTIVRAFNLNSIWTYPDGPGILLPASQDRLPPVIVDGSVDMAHVLARRQTDGKYVVLSRDGTTEVVLDTPVPFVPPSVMSPNSRFVAGKLGITFSGGLAPDVARWTVGGGYEPLDRGPDFAAAEVVDVTDDGTVYGHGYAEVGFEQPGQPYPGLQVAAAVRWNPDGSLERLEGTDGLGRAWRQFFISDISPDGSFRVGSGMVQIDSGAGNGLTETAVAAVFDDSGPSWVFRGLGIAGPPITAILDVSADGGLVAGNVQSGYNSISGMFEAPWIWSRSSGSMPFEVFLQSMGLDITNWKFGSILDMSDDGKTFLAYGSPIGANGAQVLIVIPEPGPAFLLGCGLIALASMRARK